MYQDSGTFASEDLSDQSMAAIQSAPPQDIMGISSEAVLVPGDYATRDSLSLYAGMIEPQEPEAHSAPSTENLSSDAEETPVQKLVEIELRPPLRMTFIEVSSKRGSQLFASIGYVFISDSKWNCPQ